MIDWGRVEDLRSEIGAADLAEVVALFLEEAEEVITRLRENPAPATIEGDLHFLKGSALNLGLSDLAALCQEGERRAAQGDPTGVDLAKVIAVYLASRRMFLTGLDRLSAA